MIDIAMPQILMDRAQASYKVMHEAALHSERHGIAEGLLILMLATEFAAVQYGISTSEMRKSMKQVRGMILAAQKFTGKECGLAEVVTEMGLS